MVDEGEQSPPGKDQADQFKLHRRLGFEERRSFWAWAYVAFVIAVFCLARIGLIAPVGLKVLLAPGEYYTLRNYHAQVIVHVLSISLWSFIGIVQFVPRVRRVAIGYHRWAGRVYFLCSVVIVITGLLLMPHAFGGDVASLISTVMIAFFFVASASLGLLRVRQRRVEEHRAWMLRNYAIGSSVVWSRVIIATGGVVLGKFQGLWIVMDCSEVLYALDDDHARFRSLFPLCATQAQTPVSTLPRSIVNYIAGMRMTYAASLWIGLAMNILVVEWWIRRAVRVANGTQTEPESAHD